MYLGTYFRLTLLIHFYKQLHSIQYHIYHYILLLQFRFMLVLVTYFYTFIILSISFFTKQTNLQINKSKYKNLCSFVICLSFDRCLFVFIRSFWRDFCFILNYSILNSGGVSLLFFSKKLFNIIESQCHSYPCILVQTWMQVPSYLSKYFCWSFGSEFIPHKFQ